MEPGGERVTPNGMTIDGATTAQRLPVRLVVRTQVMPAGVEVPVSVSSEALVATTSVASVGVAHAEATNCGLPSAIDEQIGLRSTLTSESIAASEPGPGGPSTGAPAPRQAPPARGGVAEESGLRAPVTWESIGASGRGPGGPSTVARAPWKPQPARRTMQAARMGPRYDESDRGSAISSSQVRRWPGWRAGRSDRQGAHRQAQA